MDGQLCSLFQHSKPVRATQEHHGQALCTRHYNLAIKAERFESWMKYVAPRCPVHSAHGLRSSYRGDPPRHIAVVVCASNRSGITPPV